MVLLQPTSILGHRKAPNGVSLAKIRREEVELLSEEFSDVSIAVTACASFTYELISSAYFYFSGVTR